MSRRRKADINSVIQFKDGTHGVIVGYRDDVAWGRYLIVRADALGRNPMGPPIWVDSPEFEVTGRISRRPGRILRANDRLGPPEVRGCACVCCPHVAGTEPEVDGE